MVTFGIPSLLNKQQDVNVAFPFVPAHDFPRRGVRLRGTYFLSLFRKYARVSIPVLGRMVKQRLALYFTDS